LTSNEGQRALIQAQRMAIRLVPHDDAQMLSAVAWAMHLDRAAAYDSFYLALAETLDCDLWTADRRLASAVGLPWVRYVGK
jgi:predicted nucleic acid-binding protein